jgi:hypothetical protein
MNANSCEGHHRDRCVVCLSSICCYTDRQHAKVQKANATKAG